MPEPEQPARRRATALRYEQGQHAPQVTATGVGLVADRIIAAAREAGVPVRHDPALAEALAALDLGDDVPPALWTAWRRRSRGRICWTRRRRRPDNAASRRSGRPVVRDRMERAEREAVRDSPASAGRAQRRSTFLPDCR